MKTPSFLSLLFASVAIYFASCGYSRANASLFGTSSLDESRVVAIAVPINEGESYNLVILEQLSQARSCWREQDNAPTVIEPLLLGFDFTGICGRSTDSNGYSLRLADEDMTWRYDLRLVFEGDGLMLKAFNTDNPWRSPINVGRTNGLAEGMLKIELNEGWTLGKRTYEGKQLGHIYIVNDQSVNQLLAKSPSRQYVADSNSTNRSNSSNQQIKVAAAGEAVQIFVPPSSQTTAIAVPDAPTTAQRSTLSMNTSGLTPLPVPDRAIPTNNSSSSGFVSLNSGNLQPPPAPISLAQSLGLNYKVIVNATTARQKEDLKQIVPDAFNTWVGDRRMMQAGAFAEELEAKELQDRLSQAGFSAEILVIP